MRPYVGRRVEQRLVGYHWQGVSGEITMAGPLKNDRQELFCLGLIEGKTAGKAYADAGFRPNRHNAHRLSTKEYIRARLAELQAERAAKWELTKDWVLNELRDNLEKAKAWKQSAAANQAANLIGKELGMFVDRKLLGIQAVITELTPEALRAAGADELLKLSQVLESALVETEEPPESKDTTGPVAVPQTT